MMRQNFALIIIILVCLLSCKGSRQGEVKISGEIKGLGNDTIYLYSVDELSDQLEPVYVNEGKFSVTLPIDTLLQMSLLFNNQQEYPIYLERGKKLTIKGDAGNLAMLEVKGSPLNEQMTAFNKMLQEQGDAPDSIVAQKVEDFIIQNNSSLICIYLLDKYFVRVDLPDFIKIKKLIDVMVGELQDKPYIQALAVLADNSRKASVGEIAPSFSIPNLLEQNISRTNYRDKYVILTFWASWCDSCRTTNEELKQIAKTYKKRMYRVPKEDKTKDATISRNTNKPKKDDKSPEVELAILGISLDLDKNDWMQIIKKDTLNWDQACDFTGWDSDVAVQYDVQQIPFNVLIDPKGKIIARGIGGEKLTKELEEIMNPKKEPNPK